MRITADFFPYKSTIIKSYAYKMKLFGILVGCTTSFLTWNAGLVSQVENQLKDLEDLLSPPEITACVTLFQTI